MKSSRRLWSLALAAGMCIGALAPARAQERTLCTSREGRAVKVLTLTDGGEADQKPAIAIIAGLDGRHTIGSDVAARLGARLRAEHGEMLKNYTVYIIAEANPDGLARFRANGRSGPDFGGALVPVDDDRDLRTDEDGPRDINGDGVITMMRIEKPAPGTGLSATTVIDADDPRLMRAPAADKHEVATHALVVEGLDADGDGRIAEDGAGGVDLTRNFPYLWPETRSDTGPYPLCEPETLGIAKFLIERTNIMLVVVYGPGDTIVRVPGAGQFDYTGRVPTGIENDDKAAFDLLSGVFKDATKMNAAPSAENAGSLHGWAYAHLGVLSFTTPVWVRPDQLKSDDAAPAQEGAQPAPAAPEDPAAAAARERAALVSQGVPDRFAEFLTAPKERRIEMMRESMSMSEAQQAELMAQVSALSPEVRARLMAAVQEVQAEFSRGAPPPAPQPAPQPAGQPLQPAVPQPGAGGQPGGPPGPGRRGPRFGGGGGGPSQAQAAPGGDEAAWLKLAKERGEGFIDWKPFDHPTLGKVEIGGFVPGFKLNPPESEIDHLVGEQAKVIADILAKMPRVEFDGLRVESLGGGLWRVSVRVTNRGELATRAAIGVKARRRVPMRLAIDLPEERVLSGQRLQRIQRLDARASQEATWVVRGDAGSTITLTLASPEFGTTPLTVTLSEGGR